MREEIARAALAVTLALASVSPTEVRATPPENCQALKDKVDHYTALRRRGGSASQMEGWKKQLRKVSAQFREEGCREYLRELR